MSPTIIALIWTLVLFTLVIATVIVGVVTLCVKDQKRTIAIDVLLSLATLVILYSLTGTLLPKTANHKQSAAAMHMDYLHQAGLISAGLTNAEYVERLNEPWRTLSRLEGVPTTKEALATAEKELRELLKEHPGDPAILERLAIVVNAAGGDVKAVVNTKANGNAAELATVRAVYLHESQQPPSAAADELLNSDLPDGWYRNALYREAYGHAGRDKYLQLERASDRKFASWSQRYITVFAVSLTSIIAATIIAFLYWRRTPERIEFPFQGYSFRAVYGCFLATLFIQTVSIFIVSFSAGVYAGFTSAIHHTKMQIPNIAPLILLVGCLSGALAALGSVKLFICRPAGISLHQTFWRDSRSSKYWLKAALAGVVVMSGARAFMEMCMGALNSVPHGTSNAIVLQLVDSVVSSNPWNFILCAGFVCLVAPITEELLFRGLLYTWLRRKWGVTVGVLVSAVVFAGAHFDLGQLPYHIMSGIILALTFERTHSLRVTTTMHAIWNCWTVIAAAAIFRY